MRALPWILGERGRRSDSPARRRRARPPRPPAAATAPRAPNPQVGGYQRCCTHASLAATTHDPPAAAIPGSAGTGICGLSLAQTGLASIQKVVLTDFGDGLALAVKNAAANGFDPETQPAVTIGPLLWGAGVETSVVPELPASIVVASDVVYNDEAARALCTTLGVLCGPKTVRQLRWPSLSAVPPATRRVMCATECRCASGADWGLSSDDITSSRLRATPHS